VAAPSKSDVGNVTNVALKDVPLRSLFPEDPAPPRAVRLPAAAACAACAAAGAACLCCWWCCLPAIMLPLLACLAPASVRGALAACAAHCKLDLSSGAKAAGEAPARLLALQAANLYPLTACRAPPSLRLLSWAAAWRGCPLQWSCLTRWVLGSGGSG
jgi:hypothetical protein